MQWYGFAIYNVFAFAIYYQFLTESQLDLPNSSLSKILYTCGLMAMVGFYSFLIILLNALFNKKNFEPIRERFTFPYLKLTIPAAIFLTIVFCNVQALSSGGGIAISVVNLNAIFTLLLGLWLYKYTPNKIVVLLLALGMVFVSGGVYLHEKEASSLGKPRSVNRLFNLK